MNIENVRKWIVALRSGEFTQGRGKLRNQDNTYCCLGVACEVYSRETGKGDWKFSNVLDCYEFRGDHNNAGHHYLSRDVSIWLYGDDPGNHLLDVVVGHDPHGSSIRGSHLNDEYNMSFKDISDIIEFCIGDVTLGELSEDLKNRLSSVNVTLIPF